MPPTDALREPLRPLAALHHYPLSAQSVLIEHLLREGPELCSGAGGLGMKTSCPQTHRCRAL